MTTHGTSSMTSRETGFVNVFVKYVRNPGSLSL